MKFFPHIFKRHAHHSQNSIFTPIDSQILSEYNATRSQNAVHLLCHAPFKSIRFAQNGYALACCNNRVAILGKYPEQSVREIWFGEAAKKLRRYVRENDLSRGCQICKQNIENRAFGSVDAQKFDYAASIDNAGGKYPVILEFQIDNICNLECIQCRGDNSSSIRKNRDHLPPLTTPYDDRFIDQLSEFLPYVFKISFAGGEPFLSAVNYKIWERSIKVNPETRISILTNGTVLSHRIRRLLVRGNFHISVSIDSMIKETYERIRVNSGYERVISNIEYFHQYSIGNGKPFSLHVCFMQQNWKEIPDMVRYCNDRDISLIYHIVYFPIDCSLFYAPQETQSKILSFYRSMNFSCSTQIRKENIYRFKSLISLLESWLGSSRESVNSSFSDNKTDIDDMDKYKFIIMSTMRRFILSDSTISPEGKENQVQRITQIFETICSRIDDETVLFNSLVNISRIPAGILVPEFNIAPIDSLVEMVKTAGRKLQPV